MRLSLHPDKHRLIFLFGILLIACGLSLGAFPLSLGQFIIAGNWIWEGNFRLKWTKLKTQKSFLLFAAFFLLHIVGLAWSTDLNYGLNDIKIKIPLLALPLIFATTDHLTKKELNTLLKVYVLGVIVSSLWSMVYFFGLRELPPNDLRKLSRFFSHIRFSMNIVYAIFVCAWFIYQNKNLTYRLLWLLACSWLVVFLFILSSFTGILIFGLLLLILVAQLVLKKSNKVVRVTLVAATLIAIWYSTTWVKETYRSYFGEKEEISLQRDLKTLSGTTYWHEPNMERENGYFVWHYLAFPELEEEWNKVSEMPFGGKDNKGNKLEFTLIRYLTSKGERKDSAGFSKLNEKDIESIENGIPNYRLVGASPFEKRMYDLMWEIYNHRESGEIRNHSLVLKMVYWKTGWEIAKQNLFFGVGTGDVQLAFNAQYEKDKSDLKTEEERKRAHNQYLTSLITLGIPGIILMLLLVFHPLSKLQNLHWLYFPVYFILFFSMFTEDTLETQAGVTMFAFFNALFLFLVPGKNKIHKVA